MNRAGRLPLQQVWGCKVAAYLFTAGTGAGAYLAGAAGRLWGDLPAAAGRPAMVLGLTLVVLAIPVLIWDLGRPDRFLRVLRARRSWLARGAWILMAFTGLAMLSLVAPDGAAARALLGLGLAAAALVALYTGLLLGDMLARPLWNTAALPVLFLVSALSTGIAAVSLLAALGGPAGFAGSGPAGFAGAGPATSGAPAVVDGAAKALGIGTSTLAVAVRPWHLGLLAAELLLLYCYLSLAHARARTAVTALVRGALAPRLWGLVVGTGLLLPLALELATPATGAAAELAAIGVLVGGYELRRLILLAGTRSGVSGPGGGFVIRPEV